MAAQTDLRLATRTLWQREMVRFFRSRNRVTGSLVQPVLFWLLFGWGLRGSFHPSGLVGSDAMGSLEYLFPGTVVMIVLFTAIFANFSIIEDRREGFLQSVLVSPAPRLAIVLGKVLGGATVAAAEALLFLVLAPFAGIPLGILGILLGALVIVLLSVALAALGYALAWRTDSTQGFHATMMLFLIPMWLLSGAFFPTDGVPSVMAWIMRFNPLTYGVHALRRALYLGTLPIGEHVLLAISLVLTAAFAAAMVAVALAVTNRRTEGSLA